MQNKPTWKKIIEDCTQQEVEKEQENAVKRGMQEEERVKKKIVSFSKGIQSFESNAGIDLLQKAQSKDGFSGDYTVADQQRIADVPICTMKQANTSFEEMDNLSAIFEESATEFFSKKNAIKSNQNHNPSAKLNNLSKYMINLSSKGNSGDKTDFIKENNSQSEKKTLKTSTKLSQTQTGSFVKPEIPKVKSTINLTIKPPGVIHITPISKTLSMLFSSYDSSKVTYLSKCSKWTIDPEYYLLIRKELKQYFKFTEIPIGLLNLYISTRTMPPLDKIVLNEHLDRTLLPFQRKSVEMAIQRKGRILLADEMGLGKTYQALAIAYYYRLEWPLLIVAPASLLENWQQSIRYLLKMPSFIVRKAEDLQFKSFKHQKIKISTQNLDHDSFDDDVIKRASTQNLDHDYSKKMKINRTSFHSLEQNNYYKKFEKEIENQKTQLHVDEAENSATQKMFHEFENQSKISKLNNNEGGEETRIFICSYDMAARLHKEISARKYKVIIADECHYLKSAQSKRSTNLLNILQNTSRLIMLSGTPATSRPIELYTTMVALCKTAFKSMSEYGYRYCNLRKKGHFFDWKGCSNSEELVFFLNSLFMVRRGKSEVLNHLPPKTRKQIIINTKKHNRLPNQPQSNNQSNSFNFKKNKYKNTELFLSDKPDPSIIQLYNEAAELKLQTVCNYINQLLTNNKKIVVFAHHAVMLNGLEDFFKPKTKIIKIDGKTLPQYRQKLVDSFQTDPSIRLALLSITACSTGLTLTEAQELVFAELYWNPGTLLQAEDRIHRIGQKYEVNIHFLTANNTVDEVVWPILLKKMAILEKCGIAKNELKNMKNEVAYKETILNFCIVDTFIDKNSLSIDTQN